MNTSKDSAELIKIFEQVCYDIAIKVKDFYDTPEDHLLLIKAKEELSSYIRELEQDRARLTYDLMEQIHK